MPARNEGFRGVSLKADLLNEIEEFIKEFSAYRSVAEFVSEAVRLRMEQVRKARKEISN